MGLDVSQAGKKPDSDKTTYHDLASSSLIFPESGFAAVYSRHSRLAEPNAERSESIMIGRTISHYRSLSLLGGG
jgi:hypothetical protein